MHTPAEAFISHGSITTEALKDFLSDFSPDATAELIHANEGQDSGKNSDQPAFHGDRLYWQNPITGKWESETHRQAFDRLRRYIKDCKDKMKELLGQCHTVQAIQELGKVTHAIQDFYSHSNFVDKGVFTDEEKKDIGDALNDPTKYPQALDKLQITGWWKGSMLGGSAAYDPLGYHHIAKAKDYFWSKGHSEAIKEATNHTKKYIETLKAEIMSQDSNIWNKLATWKRPTPPPHHTINVLRGLLLHTLNFDLEFTTYCALDLTITEVLPYGVELLDSVPAPIDIQRMPMDPDFPDVTITVATWRFVGAEPVGPVKIQFGVKASEQAKLFPEPLRGIEPQIGYAILYGEATEIDAGGTEYWSPLTPQLVLLLARPVPVFPNWYASAAAVVGAGVLAYVIRRRFVRQKS